MAEPLRIKFAADVDAAKQGMASLASSVASNALQMASTLKAVNDNAARLSSTMAVIPSVAVGIAGAVAAYLALKTVLDLVNAAADRAKERLDAVLKVARGAESAGVGTSFFQRWIGEAEKLNLEVSKLEGMLQRARTAMTDRLGENDKASSSSAADRIGQHITAGNLGKDALTRYNAMDGQENRIRVVLDLLDELKAKGANLAAFDLAGKVFGEDFEQKMRAGVDVIGKMRDALDSVKLTAANGVRVLSPEENARAEQLKNTIAETQRIMAEALAPIQRDIAAYQARQAQSAAEFNLAIAETVAWAMKLYGVFESIGKELNKLANSSFWKRLSDLSEKYGLSSFGGTELIDPITGKPSLSASGSTGAAGTGKAYIRAAPAPVDPSNSLRGTAKGGGGAASETDAVESYIQSLERSTAALKAEADAYGKSNAEKQKAIALARGEEIAKQRGTDLTDAERQKIEALGSAAGVARDRMAALQQQAQQSAEMMRTFGQAAVDSLYGMIAEGRSAADVMDNLAKMILKAALQAAIMGTGPLAGLMGTAAPAGATGASSVGGLMGMLVSLIPGRASGGPVTAGKPYIVGENGIELMVPGASGAVIPNHALRAPSIAAPVVPPGAAAGPMNFSLNVKNEMGGKAAIETSKPRSDGQGGFTMDALVREVGARLATDMNRNRGPMASSVKNQARGGSAWTVG